MKIVIIDDELSGLQAFLSEIIKKDGVEYHFFKDDIDNIINYFEHNNVDAVFLDINMPNINGIDLADKLIKLNNNIKIIFVTGYSYKINDMPDNIRNNILGIIYKPYTIEDLNAYLNILVDAKPVLYVKMFDTFDCFINGKVIDFNAKKAKELFALLLVYNGKTLEMNDAICHLWPDKDLDKAKKLYRDAVWRLRKVLSDINFNCVNFNRGSLSINKDNIKCDYWDYLLYDNGEYQDEFLKSYDWSIDYLSYLDELKAKYKEQHLLKSQI